MVQNYRMPGHLVVEILGTLIWWVSGKLRSGLTYVHPLINQSDSQIRSCRQLKASLGNSLNQDSKRYWRRYRIKQDKFSAVLISKRRKRRLVVIAIAILIVFGESLYRFFQNHARSKFWPHLPVAGAIASWIVWKVLCLRTLARSQLPRMWFCRFAF